MLTATPPPSGNTYYVSPDGNDANPGTLVLPWRTIQKAASIQVAGDTVLIKSGTYSETVRPANSGTANAYITYKAYPGHKPVVTSADWVTFRVDRNYIEVNGLTLTSSHYSGVGLNPKAAHHIRLLNNVVYGNGESGIGTSEGSDYLLIEGNVVYGNCLTSPYQGSGISLWRQVSFDQAPGFHNVIRRNVIYGNSNGVGEHTDGNGIIVDLSLDSPSVLVENNIIFGNGGQCVDVNQSNNVTVRNNTCYWNYADPLKSRILGEITAVESVNVRVFNNLIYTRNKVPPTFSWGSYGLFFDYNLTYGGLAGEQGPHDVLGNPLFVNPSLDPSLADFHLKARSPAIDAGTAIDAPDVDFSGNPSPQGLRYDIGAYEYGAQGGPGGLGTVVIEQGSGGKVSCDLTAGYKSLPLPSDLLGYYRDSNRFSRCLSCPY